MDAALLCMGRAKSQEIRKIRQMIKVRTRQKNQEAKIAAAAAEQLRQSLEESTRLQREILGVETRDVGTQYSTR